MIKLALSFLLGVLLFQTLSEFPSLWYLLTFPIVILVWLKFPQTLFLIVILLAFTWTHWFAYQQFYPQLSSDFVGEILDIDGVVEEVAHQNSNYSQFTLRLSKESLNTWPNMLPKIVRLSWYQPSHVVLKGHHCELTVKLKKLRGFSNPGSYDYEKSAFINGIGARGYVKAGKCALLSSSNYSAFVVRDYWADKFLQITSEYKYSALMQALTFAKRENITPHQWEVLRKTGTSHLLAISGLHLSAVALVVFFIVKRLSCLSATLCNVIPAQSIAAYTAIIATLFYAYLAGFTLPTQRALIMVVFVLSAILLRRPVFNLSVYASALLLVLFINPLSVLTAGFWMSFLAVLFIFIAVKACQRYSKLTRIVYVQVYLGAALFPITLFYFSEASIISPIVNLIAIPYVSFVVLPLLLLSQCISLFGAESIEWLFGFIDILLDGLWVGLEISADFHYTSWKFVPTLPGVICFEIGLFLLVQAKGLPIKHLAWCLLAALLFLKEPALKASQLRMTNLDVGQGLAVVIETANHTMLYDTGMQTPSGFNMGSAVINPYLQWRGINNIDIAMVSHNDNDHAGGMHWLLNNVVIDELMVSNQPHLYNATNITLCREGQHWVWDDVHFQVLHPPNSWQSNDNNRSCVLQISHPAGTILLTGDIEKLAEDSLIERYGDNLASNLITAPHHGSESSSSYRFVDRVHPQTVVFSAGYMNRYGFPHATISQRYTAFDVQTVDTIRQGAITFLLDPEKGIEMENGHRLKNKRYWHSTEEALTDPIE